MEMKRIILLSVLILSNTLAYPDVVIKNRPDRKIYYQVYYGNLFFICFDKSIGELEPGETHSHRREACLIDM